MVNLDISSAYDTINRKQFELLLNVCYNIQPPLSVVLTNLINMRTYYYKVNAHNRLDFSLICGIPQGSCLSSSFFNALVAPLCHKFSGIFSSYADDMKLLIGFRNNNKNQIELNLTAILDFLTSYLDVFNLKINGNKSSYQIFKRYGNICPLDIYLAGSKLNYNSETT